jgi:hypothetical protein
MFVLIPLLGVLKDAIKWILASLCFIQSVMKKRKKKEKKKILYHYKDK